MSVPASVIARRFVDMASALSLPGAYAPTVVGARTNAGAGTWTTLTPIASGVVERPVAATIVDVRSSSAADAAAGTGMQRIRLTGLDGANARISEEFDTAGIAVASSTLSFRRVNDAVGVRFGSGAAAAGNVTVEVTAAGPDFANILVTTQRARNLVYSIPAGHRGLIYGYTAQARTSVIQFRIDANKITDGLTTLSSFTTQDVVECAADRWIERVFRVPLVLAGGQDMRMRVNPVGAASVAAVAMDLVIVPDRFF